MADTSEDVAQGPCSSFASAIPPNVSSAAQAPAGIFLFMTIPVIVNEPTLEPFPGLTILRLCRIFLSKMQLRGGQSVLTVQANLGSSRAASGRNHGLRPRPGGEPRPCHGTSPVQPCGADRLAHQLSGGAQADL